MKVLLIFIFTIGYLHAEGQNTFEDSFFQQRKNIDSLSELIDANKQYIKKRYIGMDTTYGEFIADSYYNPKEKSIFKIQYTFSTDSAGVKIFYYNKDGLIKVINKKRIFYLIGGTLLNDSGEVVKTKEAIYLLLFQNNFKETVDVLR